MKIFLIPFVLLSQMLTFHLYISPGKIYMREYRYVSPLGKLFGKIDFQKKDNEKIEHIPMEIPQKKY
jgi:hypothetical protein